MANYQIKPIKWEIIGYHRPGTPLGYKELIPPTIESRGPEQLPDGSDGRERFAVMYGSHQCLDKEKNEWDYEPLPSSRDDDFFRRCRFYSIEEALEAFEKFVVAEKEREERRRRVLKTLNPDSSE
jgi:hypothetical protein